MPLESTRRNFLKISAAGLAVTVTKHANATSNTAAPPSGKAEVWVTNSSKRCERTEAIAWKTRSGSPPETVISLDPGKQFQTVLGFGAAFTDASCYMFNQLSADARTPVPRNVPSFGVGT
jgi:glucosylceramidase